jgi:hypothetical protein
MSDISCPWAPAGHPDGRPVCIRLILLCRTWSKVDVQVVVCVRLVTHWEQAPWIHRFTREAGILQAHKKQWQRLCEQIALQQDPTRFTTLVHELNKLLEENERRLDQRCALSRLPGKAK